MPKWLAISFVKIPESDEVAELVALMLSDQGGVMCGSLIDYDQEIVGTSD